MVNIAYFAIICEDDNNYNLALLLEKGKLNAISIYIVK